MQYAMRGDHLHGALSSWVAEDRKNWSVNVLQMYLGVPKKNMLRWS